LRAYAAGDALEFGLSLIGRGIDYLPYFLVGFEELGWAGLGRDRAKAKLERVEALEPFRPIGRPIYQDGRTLDTGELPTQRVADLATQASELPADLRLTLRTPLRVKARGAFIERLDLAAVVQVACWRLAALAAFHGDPWEFDYRPLVEAARQVAVEHPQIQWVDWERTSTRGEQPRQMTLGGIPGSLSDASAASLLQNMPCVCMPTVLRFLHSTGSARPSASCSSAHSRRLFRRDAADERDAAAPDGVGSTFVLRIADSR
jgi:hypothetical protein